MIIYVEMSQSVCSAETHYPKLDCISWLPVLLAGGFQLLHGLRQSLGGDLGLSTYQGLQHSIVDEGILVLGVHMDQDICT